MNPAARTPGTVITFYSFKGGTGRTMALANVAWILASRGKSVLAIDWDLEAPGLHRYFAPYLQDPQMAATDGLIDFLLKYVIAASTPPSSGTPPADDWHVGYADLRRYAEPLTWQFPDDGQLEIVGPGRQDAEYAHRVNSFDWNAFYRDFAGSNFLDAVFERLRESYDYILIDSRTGVSDTSGICTVQLPDRLAVFFTLNRQSIDGASWVAKSVLDLRGEKSPIVLPIPTRIENAEKEKLDRTRALAYSRFSDVLERLPSSVRSDYWGRVEIPYVPFYAYTEVLAVFGDTPNTAGSLLAAMESIAAVVSEGHVSKLAPISEAQRKSELARFEGESTEGEASDSDLARSRLQDDFKLVLGTSDISVLRDFEERLGEFAGVEPGLILELLFEYRRLNAWSEIVRLSEALPARLRDNLGVHEVLAQAHSQQKKQASQPAGHRGASFIIRPFGIKKDSGGNEIDFERVHHELIAPALHATGFAGWTTGQILDSGNIREDIFALLLEADLVVCDITTSNPNVFYELGIRHALRKKRTLLVRGQPTQEATPFDLLTDRYLSYPIPDPGQAIDALVAAINAGVASERPTDSPVFQMAPNLPDTDPAKVGGIVPSDFREDVDRARSVGLHASPGWLRLLSEEVRALRFQWEGLKLVARAQFDLRDWDAAAESWEAIRDIHPDDIDANLALANIHERWFRAGRGPEWLESSDQAIGRVRRAATSPHLLAEAAALRARNDKTRWRSAFEKIGNLDERRALATNRPLVRCCEDYRDAFYEDLNHGYPGLAALQMGVIALELSSLPAWAAAFPDDNAAEDYRQALAAEVERLWVLVPTAVQAELRRRPADDEDRFWAEISAADLQFLAPGAREPRVVQAYVDAIPVDRPFAWDSARGQLELFQSLGVKADLVASVISQLDARFPRKAAPSSRPIHLVIIAGHRVDAPGRPSPRFPEDKETLAKQLLREAIEGLRDDAHDLVGLASASAGTDILAHEILREAKLRSTVCLPMPKRAYAQYAFEGLDRWRNRFLDLWDAADVLVLSDRPGLPQWLSGSQVDPWERGNRWVTRLADTWGAQRVTLVAFWDGRDQGDAPGGTAHMVQLARAAGDIRIVHVDSNRLLA